MDGRDKPGHDGETEARRFMSAEKVKASNEALG